MLAVLQKCKSTSVVNSTSFSIQELRETVLYHGMMDLPEHNHVFVKCYSAINGWKERCLSAMRALTLAACVMSFFCSRRGNRGGRGCLWRIRTACLKTGFLFGVRSLERRYKKPPSE